MKLYGTEETKDRLKKLMDGKDPGTFVEKYGISKLSASKWAAGKSCPPAYVVSLLEALEREDITLGEEKDIRETIKDSGLSELAFAKTYGIPESTLKAWTRKDGGDLKRTEPDSFTKRALNGAIRTKDDRNTETLLTVQELVEKYGLRIQEFGRKYQIPRGTLDNWFRNRSNPKNPPDYVLRLFARVMKEDFGSEQ